MGLRDLRDQVCIVGVGDTPQGAVPDKTGDELAIDAVKAALADCGLNKNDLDGLFVQRSYGGQGDYLKVLRHVQVYLELGTDGERNAALEESSIPR